jgi:ABC-type antimicrobial peptide transport system permease subunit
VEPATLLLHSLGLLSVVSFGIVQRTSEFGVRMALGASRDHILWIAVRMTALSVATGMVIGWTGAMLIRRFLERWMNIGSAGFQSLLEATLFLALCSMAACLLPARRAASIHPAEALRYE